MREDVEVAYDDDLAHRIRELLVDEDGVSERPMFGGLSFLIGGHMAVAVSSKGGLLVRVGPDAYAQAIAHPDASEFVMRDRTMLGWVRVGPEGVRTKRKLSPWVRRGAAFARTLPPKGR